MKQDFCHISDSKIDDFVDSIGDVMNRKEKEGYYLHDIQYFLPQGEDRSFYHAFLLFNEVK